MKPYSISGRLIATVLLIELVSALCVTGLALLYERHSHFHSFDVLLRGRADSMLGAVQDAEDTNDNVMLDGTEVTVPSDDIYEVVDARGQVLGRSANWSGGLAPRPSDSIAWSPRDRDEGSFSSTVVNGQVYRVIRMRGLRIVDPGDKGGGIRRYVTIYYGSSVKRVWNAVLRTVGFYAISSLIVLACTGILMSWLLNRGLAPLRELALGASKVSVTSWSFHPSQRARMTKELGPLVSALESLIAGLQESFELQRRFVGDAAHELKTSVAVVKSSLQLLEMKPRSKEEYQAGLAQCLTDCERMEGVVAQMLSLARLEEGKEKGFADCRTDVFHCVSEAAAQLASMAQASRIPILIHGEKTLSANIDPHQFKLLCTNLLINGLQHSRVDSVVAVDIERRSAFAELRFCDDGEGIAPDDLPHIFERFSRSDPSRSRKTGGTGLGLAICKAIVECFRGTIEISSQLNVGTIVVVRIPLAEDEPPRSIAL